MARPTLENATNYRTSSEVCSLLNLSRSQLVLRINRHIFPPPTFVDAHFNKFFSKEWMDRVRKIQEEKNKGAADQTVPS